MLIEWNETDLSQRWDHIKDELASLVPEPNDTPGYWTCFITITNAGCTIRIQTLHDDNDDGADTPNCRVPHGYASHWDELDNGPLADMDCTSKETP